MASEKLFFTKAVLISSDDRYKTFPCGETFDGTAESGRKLAQLVMKAEDYNKANRYREILSANVYIFVASVEKTSAYAKVIDAYCASFSIDNVTDFNDPTHVSAWKGRVLSASNAGKYVKFDVYTGANAGFPIVWASVVNGVHFNPVDDLNSYNWTIQTPFGANPPYITIEYGETIGLNAVNLTFPTSGANLLKSAKNTFTWNIDSPNPNPDYNGFGNRKTIERIEVASTILRWRYAGNTSYQEISAGTGSSYTFPANTFNAGEIEWQVSVTSNSGIQTTSDWNSALVQDVLSDARAISPDRVSVNGSIPNVFLWEHIISTGSQQTGFDLQTSKDQSIWENLVSGNTSEQFVTVDKNKLSGGTLYWRVRTYNSDGTPGNWSEPAQIYVVAAPDAPIVAVANPSPKFSLRWQQTGQQAYEIRLNDIQIAKTYSLESFYTHHSYLDPGNYTVQVRIQNETGLWSDWGTSLLPISNQESEPIALTAKGDNAVDLRWATNGNYSSFIIYRNGEKIAQTDKFAFTDHFAIGEALYQVRGIYSDNGYFTLSNVEKVLISVPYIMISAVKNPSWVNLRLSTASLRSIKQFATKSVTYTQYVGNKLPSAEIGEAETRTLNVDCAFLARDIESWKSFEALLGKLVCIKSPNGERFIGVLDQYNKENVWPMHISYNANVTIVSWKEDML